MKTTRLYRKLLFGKTTKFMCFFASSPISHCIYLFRRNDHLTRNTSSTPYLHKLFKGEREYICFKNFSEYEVKQSLTWRELFAIQFALQSFAPKISNKSVCWETENSAASLTVTSESYNTGSLDQIPKVIKHLKTSKVKALSWYPFGTQLRLFYNLTFQWNRIVTQLLIIYLPTTSMFSAGE